MKSFIITDNSKGAVYNADSVNQSIASHNRRSRNKIGKGEASLIHALLKGHAPITDDDETPYGEELCRNGIPIADCTCC